MTPQVTRIYKCISISGAAFYSAFVSILMWVWNPMASLSSPLVIFLALSEHSQVIITSHAFCPILPLFSLSVSSVSHGLCLYFPCFFICSELNLFVSLSFWQRPSLRLLNLFILISEYHLISGCQVCYTFSPRDSALISPCESQKQGSKFCSTKQNRVITYLSLLFLSFSLSPSSFLIYNSFSNSTPLFNVYKFSHTYICFNVSKPFCQCADNHTNSTITSDYSELELTQPFGYDYIILLKLLDN